MTTSLIRSLKTTIILFTRRLRACVTASARWPTRRPAPPARRVVGPLREREAHAASKAERDAAHAALAAVPPLPTWWIGNFEPAPGPFRVFLGGDPQRPGSRHGSQSWRPRSGRTGL